MQITDLVPIIQGDNNYPEISVAFYPDMVSPQNSDAESALKNFHTAIQKVGFGVDIAPGRLIYVNNRFTLHSRDQFIPTFDKRGNALRWVQRVLVAPDLWNDRNLRQVKKRVFTPVTVII
ncbi:hypothetical protein QF028_000291 [Neobacillus sp. B4I6]|uniref:hypothetical protein n=1 Tax=Neobacillus sp. B4I6 TaxID=3373925 RepID=UPI003D24517D